MSTSPCTFVIFASCPAPPLNIHQHLTAMSRDLLLPISDLTVWEGRTRWWNGAGLIPTAKVFIFPRTGWCVFVYIHLQDWWHFIFLISPVPLHERKRVYQYSEYSSNGVSLTETILTALGYESYVVKIRDPCDEGFWKHVIGVCEPWDGDMRTM